ncbi:hypothetical protein RCL_jg18099.t1 [Rhizophagus clarus]|uniref:Uncharacterized protein n=1 Tax=Rhizophagus clarus TaxID=94130 RepID=A0A8H3QN62_9GLOM|nr:hypothetical protein RCL_jg18099.t1 [Rhizophagus clarus]
MGIDSTCLEENCENAEIIRQRLIENNNDLIKLKDHVFVNLIRIGILNFVVYSHRCSSKAAPTFRCVEEGHERISNPSLNKIVII